MPVTQYDNLIVFYTHLKGDKSPLDLEGPRVLYITKNEYGTDDKKFGDQFRG